jgi:hypothetical protein
MELERIFHIDFAVFRVYTILSGTYSRLRKERTLRTQTVVQAQTQWFCSGYAHGFKGAKGMPKEPTERAVVDVIQRILSIYRDDGAISQEQLRYEAGLLTGYLVSTIGR